MQVCGEEARWKEAQAKATYSCGKMSRGNQRDTDRARAAKRAADKAKPAKEKDGLSAAQRRERDAAALQAKQAKKQGAEAGK